MQLLLAISPIIILIITLSIFKIAAHKAAVISFLFGTIISYFYFGTGVKTIQCATLNGVKTGLFPIALVIISALYTYGITVSSGAMEKIKESLKCVSLNEEVLMLLIICGFGNFMEGMAGFGTAVGVPAALLVGIGINPYKAVISALIANTAPTAFGSIGVPITTLSDVGCLNPLKLSGVTSAIQLSVMAIVPFCVLFVANGFNSIKRYWKLALITDIAFLVPWWGIAKFVGCELPDIIGGISVMLVLGFFGRDDKHTKNITFKSVMYAWLPFSLVVFALSILAFVPSEYKISPGIVIFIAATIGGLLQKLSPLRLVKEFYQTFLKYHKAIVTICMVLALSKVMDESGMIKVMATALVDSTGRFVAFFSPLVGALGGFVTGSGTSSSVLFGGLQVDTAKNLGFSPEWFAAANVMGAGIGKMISPQSIAIGAAATSLIGKEGDILKKTFMYFVPIIIWVSLICGLLANIKLD